jgi:hypothetical protein
VFKIFAFGRLCKKLANGIMEGLFSIVEGRKKQFQRRKGNNKLEY